MKAQHYMHYVCSICKAHSQHMLYDREYETEADMLDDWNNHDCYYWSQTGDFRRLPEIGQEAES